MILADTSVWIDHFRNGDPRMVGLLGAGRILAHPCVIGELALGNLRNRTTIIGDLRRLPRAQVATDDEVLHMIERQALSGLGIGYVDAHLLAAVQLTPGSTLWTKDTRLDAAAKAAGLSAP